MKRKSIELVKEIDFLKLFYHIGAILSILKLKKKCKIFKKLLFFNEKEFEFETFFVNCVYPIRNS